ncbi:hypothetical protein [Micrococcus flavus]|uniref:Acetone carboxylase n=1 Tax=Micrococcus flavus TaxID=384602 RepID=A0A7W7L305_9MICC|nr:hypothetical protein [Micrococcus flavus]MBB4882687.1 hypothetical protein [Micrococcus flavus]GGK39439.1 hypothetical protein GCM10007073_02620 [Micrococcus flavus]
MTGPDLLGALAAGHDPGAPSASASRPSEEARAADGSPVCSRRGCPAPAVWALHWNNPRVHTPDRRKTWTACEAHRAHLEDFLASRGFLQDVTALTDPTPREETA